MSDILSGANDNQTERSQARRMPCPDCNSPIPMKFIFPARQASPCFEVNAWRFQRCQYCGWQGDVARRMRVTIHREPLVGWFINDRFYTVFDQWLVEQGLC